MKRYQFDNEVHKKLIESFLTINKLLERAGIKEDLTVLTEHDWLKNTAVIELIAYKKGMWEIQLIFAHHEDPMKFVKRIISRYSSKKKAELVATYMRRQAAKDSRGTLTIDLDFFNLCFS